MKQNPIFYCTFTGILSTAGFCVFYYYFSILSLNETQKTISAGCRCRMLLPVFSSFWDSGRKRRQIKTLNVNLSQLFQFFKPPI